MTSEPLVSILLPTYNRAHLLPEAIRSVLRQTYRNWELIVWDDGSTDNTREVVAAFEDPRIQYHRQANAGQFAALNRALGVAVGAYIAFLDDDDQWTDDKLHVQMRVLESINTIDVLFSDFVNINLVEHSERRCFEQNAEGLRSLVVAEITRSVFAIERGMPEALLKENFIGQDTVLVRTEVLRKMCGFSEHVRSGGDVELWWRMALAGVRFGYVNQVLMRRVKHPGSLSSASLTNCLNHLKCLDLCWQHTVVNGRPELLPYLNEAYHRAWLRLARQCAEEGDKTTALKACIRALRYRYSLIAGYEILRAMAGPRVSEPLRGLAQIVKRKIVCS